MSSASARQEMQGKISEEGFKEARGIIGKSLLKGGKGRSVVSGGESYFLFLQPPQSCAGVFIDENALVVVS